jgi:hypothetical protein
MQMAPEFTAHRGVLGRMSVDAQRFEKMERLSFIKAHDAVKV